MDQYVRGAVEVAFTIERDRYAKWIMARKRVKHDAYSNISGWAEENRLAIVACDTAGDEWQKSYLDLERVCRVYGWDGAASVDIFLRGCGLQPRT